MRGKGRSMDVRWALARLVPQHGDELVGRDGLAVARATGASPERFRVLRTGHWPGAGLPEGWHCVVAVSRRTGKTVAVAVDEWREVWLLQAEWAEALREAGQCG